MKEFSNKKYSTVAEMLNLKWEMQFYELKKFKKVHGHCDVPYNIKRYRRLARWIDHQRNIRKFSPLRYNPDYIQKLNDIGFCWSKKEKKWMKMLNSFLEYLRTHNNKYPPVNEKSISPWIRTQRIIRKAGTMPGERIRMLDNIGFMWIPQKSRWEKKLAELVIYKKEYGNANVNRKINESLNMWVIRQRRLYREKNKLLTAEKIGKLNNLGFDWINPLKVSDGQRINDTDLLNELKRLYSLSGKSPSMGYIDKYGKFCSKVYYLHFGSMVNARIAAGLPPGIGQSNTGKNEKK